MNLLKWDVSFSVYNEEMNSQHKELINILNLLDVAITEGKDKAAAKYALQRMMEYSISHFSAEEALMKEIRFPDREMHLGEHAEYIKYVTGALHDSWDNKPGLPVELLTFLRIWWKNHIKGTDIKYGLYIKNKH